MPYEDLTRRDDSKIDFEFLKTKCVALFIERPPMNGKHGIYSLRWYNNNAFSIRSQDWILIQTFDSPDIAKIWADVYDIKLTS